MSAEVYWKPEGSYLCLLIRSRNASTLAPFISATCNICGLIPCLQTLAASPTKHIWACT